DPPTPPLGPPGREHPRPPTPPLQSFNLSLSLSISFSFSPSQISHYPWLKEATPATNPRPSKPKSPRRTTHRQVGILIEEGEETSCSRARSDRFEFREPRGAC